MDQRVVRRLTSFGGAAIAAGLAFSSAAYACTNLTGQLTVTGQGGTQSVAVGDNSGSHMQCTVSGGAEAQPGDNITVGVGPYVNTGPADPCISSGFGPSDDAPGGPTWVRNDECWIGDTPNPACANGQGSYHRLEGKGVGNYEVRVISGEAFTINGTTYAHDFNGPTSQQCFEGRGNEDGYQVIGTVSVDQDGASAWDLQVPLSTVLSGPTEAAGICVYADRDQVNSPEATTADPWSLVYGAGSYWNDNAQRQFTNMAPLRIVL